MGVGNWVSTGVRTLEWTGESLFWSGSSSVHADTCSTDSGGVGTAWCDDHQSEETHPVVMAARLYRRHSSSDRIWLLRLPPHHGCRGIEHTSVHPNGVPTVFPVILRSGATRRIQNPHSHYCGFWALRVAEPVLRERQRLAVLRRVTAWGWSGPLRRSLCCGARQRDSQCAGRRA